MLKLQKKIENMKGSKIKQSNNKNNKWRKLNEHPVFFILDLKENILEEITFIICSKSKRSEIEEDQWKAGCRTWKRKEVEEKNEQAEDETETGTGKGREEGVGIVYCDFF